MSGRLLFVYNADSGILNTLADIAHKVVAPATYPCELCAVTHHWFAARSEWKRFVSGLPVKCEFLHRDEFHSRYPALAHLELPIVLKEVQGELQPCLERGAIAEAGDLATLKQQLLARCTGTAAETADSHRP